MGGDGGTFQYFVFVSGQEILSRKSTIVSAKAKNLANQFALGMTSSSSALFPSYNSLVIWSGLSRTAVTLGSMVSTLSNGKQP